jgi:hypothetical protein
MSQKAAQSSYKRCTIFASLLEPVELVHRVLGLQQLARFIRQIKMRRVSLHIPASQRPGEKEHLLERDPIP